MQQSFSKTETQFSKIKANWEQKFSKLLNCRNLTKFQEQFVAPQSRTHKKSKLREKQRFCGWAGVVKKLFSANLAA